MSFALRCAVNVSAWPVHGGSSAEWEFLNSLLTPEERGRVAKFVHLDDRKRALVSQLLQRWACERALGVPFRHVALQRTKGGKPFLTAEAAVRPVAAANWNFNVSHEGDYVVMAAEPLCVCGVDVAAPAQLRRKGAGSPPMSQLLASFSRQLAARETQYILTAGSEAAQQDAFQKIWSLKEAFVKARGDGLAFDLGQLDFRVDEHRGSASVRINGVEDDNWAFSLSQVGGAAKHWVTVARCHPRCVVDANGHFRKTLRKLDFDSREWEAALRAPQPTLEVLLISDLLPSDAQEQYETLELIN